MRLLAGAVLVLLPVLAALLPRHAPEPAQALLPPGPGFPFGTDAAGQDLLALALGGLRLELAAALVAAAQALPAVALGLAAGWRGGWAGMLLRAVSAVFRALPLLLSALLLALALPAAPLAAVLALAWGPRLAAAAGAEAARLRAAPFMDALAGLGLAPRRRALHLAANAAPALAAETLDGLRDALLVVATLGFLGLGPQELGWQVAAAQPALPEAWWWALFPVLVLALPCLGLTLLAGAARALAR